MLKIILIVGLLISGIANAGPAVSGGRITALGDSKARINAATEAITEPSLMITDVSLLPNDQVKVNLTSPNDGSCRAVIFELALLDSSIGGANYKAKNPQRAQCN